MTWTSRSMYNKFAAAFSLAPYIPSVESAQNPLENNQLLNKDHVY